MSDDGLFDTPAPIADPYAGMGQDAKRTAKQLESIAAGIHPATKISLHSSAALTKGAEGLRCGDCSHLYRKSGHFQGTFFKCDETGARNTGPDMRRWWPACTLFDPREDHS